MKKKGFQVIELLIIFIAVIQLSASAQTPKYFIISGKVLSETEISENITLQIIKNDQTAVVSQIPDHRRFRLELTYNSQYKLTFYQNGNISKTIIVNTEIPSELLQRENEFPHFLMAVKLEKAIYQEEENLSSSNLVQHIVYSQEKDDFTRVPTIFDIEYVEQKSLTSRQMMKLIDGKSKSQHYQIF